MKLQLLSDLPYRGASATCRSARRPGRRAAGAGRRHRLLPGRLVAGRAATSAWPVSRPGTAGRCRCSTFPATTSTTTLDFDATHAAAARDLRARWTSLWLERETAGRSAACASSAPRCGPTSTRWSMHRRRPTERSSRSADKAMRAANFYLQKAATHARRPDLARRGLARAGTDMPGLAARGAGADRSTARRWSSRTSRRACAAPIRATASRPGTAGFCNCAGRTAAAGRALAAWPPALPARLP